MKYNFVDDAGALLAKYAKDPPSIELHVHPTHYRFSNQEGIIPRNHPSIQEFLKSVEQGVILPAATEVFRDSGTRFYEGRIILKIIDYTDKEPASYRILLEPTDLTLWHELLYTTDASQGRFTDQQALAMESEVLNLTIRHLDLRVPPAKLATKAPLLDAKLKPFTTRHRVTKPKQPKPLHREAPVQSGSAYEDFMLLASGDKAPNNTNQFMRLSFIEQMRSRRADAQGQHAAGQPLPNHPQGPPGSGAPMGRVANPQQIQQLQRQQLHGVQMPGTPTNGQIPPLGGMSPQIPQNMPVNSPGVRARQMQQQHAQAQAQAQQQQRARMNGMTAAHAQVQQQAHAHAMRSGMNMNMRPGVPQGPQGPHGVPQVPSQLPGGQPMPGQPHPGQPHPGQPLPGQPLPGQIPQVPGPVPGQVPAQMRGNPNMMFRQGQTPRVQNQMPYSPNLM